jgi:apolipoprotein N-acyltransferase
MISIAQGNVDQGMKWLPKNQADTIRKYVKISLDAIRKHKPKVVIWPETAMPFYLQDRTPFREAIQILAQDSKTSIILGSPAYKVTDMKTNQYVLFNRAWLMNDAGHTTQSYDKEHLVPFGEYMPLKEWVPFEKLVQAAGDFKPGEGNKPLYLDGVALGMLICYEAIFPELAQKQVEQGASALLNISNDAWFGDTSAPKQHLNLSIMRAVEQGRWLVRGTNTGISAFVDPVGRIVAIGTQFQAESLSAKIAPLKGKTIFHQIYPWLGFLIYILTFTSFAWVGYATRQKN